MSQTDMACEPVIVRPQTSYNDVMAYLHTINISREDKISVGRQLLFESENENKAKLLIRLDRLAMLGYDWDGYGAVPILPQVFDNLKGVVGISDDEDWTNWMVSPETNGTLCLQSKSRMSSISLGTNEFSYYSYSTKGEFGKSHISFSPKQFLTIMRKIV